MAPGATQRPRWPTSEREIGALPPPGVEVDASRVAGIGVGPFRAVREYEMQDARGAYAEVTEGICERLGGKRAGFAVRSSSALQGNICCEKSPECDTAQESKFMWTSEANCNLRKGHVIPGWPQNRAPYELTYDEFQRKLEHGVCCAEEVRK